MNAPKAHRFLLSAVFLSFLGVSAVQAAKSNDYQPELDTKQIQPHTADEISNEPKAEGAKGQPASNQSGMNKSSERTTDTPKSSDNKSAKDSNESAATTNRTQPNSDSAKTDSRAPATDASTDAMTQRNQDTTDSSKIDTSSSVKEGNENTTSEAKPSHAETSKSANSSDSKDANESATTGRSQSHSDRSKKDDAITDSNETGTVHHNQNSPEFKRDKAKCEKLVGQSQDQCLLDLQKKYNMPNSK